MRRMDRGVRSGGWNVANRATLVGVGAMCIVSVTEAASAQGSSEPKIRATGAVPASVEIIGTFPTTPTYRAFLPEKVDLSRHFPTPRSQGEQGSCVGWAVGYAARAYYSQVKENKSVRKRANVPSPAYIFNSIRADLPDCEGGSRIYDALNLLKNGALSFEEFPYSDRTCPRPSSTQIIAATGFRISDWRYVHYPNLDQVKGELAQGNPVIISMRARQGFHSLRRGHVYDEDHSESTGFHAVTVTGYDERRQAFRVINSWGTDWADSGYGWISYRAFAREVREAYTIRVAGSNPQPEPVVVQPEPTPAPVKPINVVGLECGHVQVGTRRGQLVATGFVGSATDMRKLAAQLATGDVINEVELRPWPQCETLLTLKKELSSPLKPKITFTMNEDDLTHEKLLVFEVAMPSFPGYLHLAYIQADGSVVNLRQSSGPSLETLPAGTQLRLGDGTAGLPKFRIGPPFGSEMMLVIASRSPLFTKPRPPVETEREFLTALRQAIVAMPAGSGEARLVSASYQSLVTKDGRVVP